MTVALNPEAAQRRAYAEAQLKVSKSGKIAIGHEFHAELLNDGFTESQIQRALLRAPKYLNGNAENNLRALRTACGWVMDEDRKVAAPRRPFTSRSGRPSL